MQPEDRYVFKRGPGMLSENKNTKFAQEPPNKLVYRLILAF